MISSVLHHTLYFPVFIIALPIPLRSTGQRNRQKGANRRPERHCSFRRDF